MNTKAGLLKLGLTEIYVFLKVPHPSEGVVETLEAAKQHWDSYRGLGWEGGGLTALTTQSLSSACK